MEDRIESLERRLAEMENRVDAITRSSRRRLAAAALVAGLAIAWSATPEARAQFGLTLTGLNARLVAVEAKTGPVTLDLPNNNYVISGMNVVIVDGTGSTDSNSGLGNLTIGYNMTRSADSTVNPNARTGSHNLILGDQNNYTSYGGLVAGSGNQIEGPYSSVSGGSENTASGQFASVSGGFSNLATFEASSISGGEFNTASGGGASVSGGANNTASGSGASVSGGQFNTASGFTASVSGGLMRSAPDTNNWAGGGVSQAN